jgi:poly-gamma-glutamate capsule biosynthesis protein CapA/YwtB (metallophosphatase superfamily)
MASTKLKKSHPARYISPDATFSERNLLNLHSALCAFALHVGTIRRSIFVIFIFCYAVITGYIPCLTQEPASKAHSDGRAVIAFGGDVMVPATVGKAETADFISGLAETFSKSDAAFVNLEGPIGGKSADAKKCRSENCYSLQQSPWIAESLAQIGVRVVSVANNHAQDRGKSGMASTDAALARAGIKPAGKLNGNIAVLEIGRMRIAFLGFASFTGVPDLRERDAAMAQIREAKAHYDAVVVSMHAGCEGEIASVIPNGDEHCFGENRGNTKGFARAAADAGATIVVGHGPHVPRGWEIWNGVPIFYSLGNLATGAGIHVGGKSALAPVLVATFERKQDGTVKVAGFDIVSFRQESGMGPRLDPEGAAKNEMIALSGSINNPPPVTPKHMVQSSQHSKKRNSKTINQ